MTEKKRSLRQAAGAALLALLMLAVPAVLAEAPAEEEAPSLYADPRDVRESGDYEYIVLPDGTAGVFRYWGPGSDVTVPAELDGIPVTEIGDSAFEDYHDLDVLTVPEGVRAIRKYAFSGCSSLTDVSLPDSLTLLCDGAFSNTSRLESLVIPDGVAEIGDGAFFNSGLKTVTLPAGLRRIGSQAFQMTKLESVAVPEGTEEIDNLAFCDCGGLKEIFLPDSVTAVTGNPFLYCAALTDIRFSGSHPYLELKDGVLFSRPDARLIWYPDCLGAEEYAVPEGTRAIGYGAFRNLRRITVPDSVETIGDYAFGNCPLVSAEIPDSVTALGSGVFYRCSQLREVTLSAGLKEIPVMTFDGCYALESLTMPEGVTGISGNAFRDCRSLKSLRLPDSLAKIGERAFSGCKALESLTVPPGVTEIGPGAFQGCEALTVTVEKGSYAQEYCTENRVPWLYE